MEALEYAMAATWIHLASNCTSRNVSAIGEAPLNGILEGTGNVICLDVLRQQMQREPETVDAFLTEVRLARGADARLDAFTDGLERRLANLPELEPIARRVIELMAFALQGSAVRPLLDARDGRRLCADAS